MNVEIKLFFNLAQYLPPGSEKSSARISLAEGTTVHDLLQQLNLPADITKTVLVNGIRTEDGAPLHEGDSIAVFPPMAGG